MRTTSGLVFAAISLLAALLTGCAPVPSPSVPERAQKPCRICVQSPSSVTLIRGETTKAIWTVTGTTMPVRVHVQNRNSQAVRIAGGDDQFVMSSGGTPNAIILDVTALSPGLFVVHVEIDEQEVISAAYRLEVRRLAEYVRDRSARPQSRREVLEVLDSTKGQLQRALPYEELTAFRDAVDEKIDELRREAEALAAKEEGIVLVAQRSSGQSILSRLADFLFRAADTEPLTEICVVTLPVNGARLRLYPRSAPDTTERVTATRFPIYVGLYQWQIQRNGYLPSTGFINFLTDPDRIVECTLRRGEHDANVCDAVIGNLNQRCRQ